MKETTVITLRNGSTITVVDDGDSDLVGSNLTAPFDGCFDVIAQETLEWDRDGFYPVGLV